VVGDRVRLYLVSEVSGGPVAGEGNYVEVAADDVARVETVPDAVPQGLKPLSMAGSYGTHSTSLRAGSVAPYQFMFFSSPRTCSPFGKRAGDIFLY